MGAVRGGQDSSPPSVLNWKTDTARSFTRNRHHQQVTQQKPILSPEKAKGLKPHHTVAEHSQGTQLVPTNSRVRSVAPASDFGRQAPGGNLVKTRIRLCSSKAGDCPILLPLISSKEDSDSFSLSKKRFELQKNYKGLSVWDSSQFELSLFS